MTKKDYIYNGVYLTILVAYYFFNVEVFNYTFKETEKIKDLEELNMTRSRLRENKIDVMRIKLSD